MEICSFDFPCGKNTLDVFSMRKLVSCSFSGGKDLFSDRNFYIFRGTISEPKDGLVVRVCAAHSTVLVVSTGIFLT